MRRVAIRAWRSLSASKPSPASSGGRKMAAATDGNDELGRIKTQQHGSAHALSGLRPSSVEPGTKLCRCVQCPSRSDCY